jgi:competence protein ComEA
VFLTINKKEEVMKRKITCISMAGIILVLATTATAFLAPVVMANSDSASLIVNINTADTEELTTLPGIGEAKATAIVEYRAEHGPFKTVDELTNIRGISNRIIDKIRDLIRTN